MPLVTLNVGGTEYTTALSTLCRCPDSMLARMFEGDFPPTEKDGKDRYACKDWGLVSLVIAQDLEQAMIVVLVVDSDPHSLL